MIKEHVFQLKDGKILSVNQGDVLLLEDKRMIRFLDDHTDLVHIYRFQLIDRTHETYMNDLENFSIECSLGQSPEVIASFYSAWSINMRLNKEFE